MKKGSITPFCALCLMLVASLIFVLLESGRVYGLERYAELKAEAGMDSVCAEFQPLLWQQYGLLLLDGAYGTGHFSMDYVSESLKKQIEKSCRTEEGLTGRFGLDLFTLSVSNVNPENYALVTDDDGAVFLNYIAERMKEDTPLGVVEDLYEQYHAGRKVEEENGGVEDAMEEAREVLAQIEAEPLEEQQAEEKNALESTWNSIAKMQESGTLNLILGDLSAVSGKASEPQSDLQTRTKQEGNMPSAAEGDWYQKILVLMYMEKYFSNYTNNLAGHFLDYEMEYVLCGKDMEWENLEGALNRILLVREAANVAYLLQDKEKMMAAESLANLLGLLAGENPAVVKTLQIGIIGAWAYLESILDVRALLAGDVIPLIKKGNEWTTDVKNIWTSFEQNAKAKTCETGLSYGDYLKQLLFLLNKEELAYRMMEVMELSLQSHGDYQNCRMEQMLVAMKYQVRFESNPVFFSLAVIGDSYHGRFYFTKEAERSYIP